MDANSRTGNAKFYKDVRVLNLPSDDPTLPIDLDVILSGELPEGAMYLRCNELEVLDKGEKNKSKQELQATGRVYVQGKEFHARAEVMHYNQEKDQIILDGTTTGVAILYKQKYHGGPIEKIEGKKILYIRRTGYARVEEAGSLSGESMPGK
jgi:lipopolysaccharide export system protein LptA